MRSGAVALLVEFRLNRNQTKKEPQSGSEVDREVQTSGPATQNEFQKDWSVQLMPRKA